MSNLVNKSAQFARYSRVAGRLGLANSSLTQQATAIITSAGLPQLNNATQVRHYHEKVLDHYENPRNVGSMKKDDKDVGTGLVGAPACGDVMKLQIKVDESGKIIDAKFKTFGCGSAIASSSLATEWIKGKSMEQASSIKNTHIAKELKLPPVKLHCSMLAEDAIKAALKDVQEKRTALKQQQQRQQMAGEDSEKSTSA